MTAERVIGSHPDGARHLATAAVGGAVLLVSANDGDLRVWDWVTGAELARSVDGYDGVNGLTVCRLDATRAVVAVVTGVTTTVRHRLNRGHCSGSPTTWSATPASADTATSRTSSGR